MHTSLTSPTGFVEEPSKTDGNADLYDRKYGLQEPDHQALQELKERYLKRKRQQRNYQSTKPSRSQAKQRRKQRLKTR